MSSRVMSPQAGSDRQSLRPPGIIERAFELASSGECSDLEQIRARLKVEQYGGIEPHLSGSLIRKQLRALLAEGDA